MSTRFRCVAPAQSIANSQASCASWPEPASFPDPGEVYCGLRDRSIGKLPISTAGPHRKALHDRRDPEWMLWVLVGLLTVIMCLPGLKSLLRPPESRGNGRWR